MPPAALVGLTHVASSVRELDWDRFFLALDVVLRYLIPCESFSLYLVEERGKYLRKVNTYVDALPPERRGHAVEAVSEATMEGSASISVEPCSLPSQTRFSYEWAAREAMGVHPKPGLPTLDDVAAGRLKRGPFGGEVDGVSESQDHGAAVVEKVHNVLAWPLRFGTSEQDFDDPFNDYSSVDSTCMGADETVFGVIKLTNRLSTVSRDQLRRMKPQGKLAKADYRYKPFAEVDLRMLQALTGLLRELYFAIDPLTFGPRTEPSLDFGGNEGEPLNAPNSLRGGSTMNTRSMQSGSRMLEGGAKSGGLFGVLGSAFAKGAAHRRRAPELPDLVPRPDVVVTSDSTESMRSAPGWINKEWTEDDTEGITAERARAGQRRIGGITILATWRLREGAIVDPFCVICRFQLRVKRFYTSRSAPRPWRLLPSFFTISPDETTQTYCSFITEYIQYGEEYVVSVRAGSADRWSEWSEESKAIRLEASPLAPLNPMDQLECEILAPEESVLADAFDLHSHRFSFTWPAFATFDVRSPLPVEYCIEVWQRVDVLGAATLEQVQCHSRDPSASGDMHGIHEYVPGAGLDWAHAHCSVIGTITSEVLVQTQIHLTLDCRRTGLVPGSNVFFSVRGRYASLPGVVEWCEARLFIEAPVRVPELRPRLPTPLPVCAEEFQAPLSLATRISRPVPDTLVVKWPFGDPSRFCPPDPDDPGSWRRGRFAPNAMPSDFPLPYRLQFRYVEVGTTDGAAFHWREALAYDFVGRKIPCQVLSQQKSITRCDTVSDDPAERPCGPVNEHWALHATGFGADKTSSGLVQVRWISCSVEGVVSVASPILCTIVSAPRSAPFVQHVVKNCSAGNVSGRGVQEVCVKDSEEEILYELRQVARLRWEMDRTAPSYTFLTAFSIRYKEAPPGLQLVAAQWHELPPMPITDVVDLTQAGGASVAGLSFDLESVPLVRHHQYEFGIQMRSEGHTSAWSAASAPVELMLPEVTASSVSVSALSTEGRPVGEGTIEAEVCCFDHTSASGWHVTLKWNQFVYKDGGLTTFPELGSLPFEFQISYYVISERPGASDGKVGSQISAEESRERATRYLGRHSADDDATLDHQRKSATVCCEGWVDAHEEVVERTLWRHRLPPLRCDVRLFVVCRVPVVTGPQWSKRALFVDIALPRHAPLPLPVPRQLSCLELQARGVLPDYGAPSAEGAIPEHVPNNGLWAMLAIPAFHTEFVLAGTELEDNQEEGADRGTTLQDLLALDVQDMSARSEIGRAHYVLQFCRQDAEVTGPLCTGARPLNEESEWRTVRSVNRIADAGTEYIYLASGFDGVDNSILGEVHFVKFRLASRLHSHFSYCSPLACISVLPAPSKPAPLVEWSDSPSLHGAKLRLSAFACPLCETYQLRFRLASSDPGLVASWTECEVQEMQRLVATAPSQEQVFFEALAPMERLCYHSEYQFSLRIASPARFSEWSEDSEPVRLSLEHHGMIPNVAGSGEEAAGIEVRLLGLEGRHNYRCPAVEVSWPPLTFPDGVWGPESYSPSPELTIEYRVRWRRHIRAHNDRVALGAVVEELGEASGSSILQPDPDAGVVDAAQRGYLNDCTKYPCPDHEVSPWQTVAVMPAKAVGSTAVSKCCCALVCLQEGCDYDVAVDWRWRRLGDYFWMSAYEPCRFTTRLPTPSPPQPLQLQLPPEAWDASKELREFLGVGRRLMLAWPFAKPPSSQILVSPLGEHLSLEALEAPLALGAFAVQCRQGDKAAWFTCQSQFMVWHGKPLCLVACDAASFASQAGAARLAPQPPPTEEVAPGIVGGDELEFRIIRVGDCEVSPAAVCSVEQLLPPVEVRCGLKMLPPHSTLVACLRFQASVAMGNSSIPHAYQLRVDEEKGVSHLLLPVQLPLERRPEAFGKLRAHHGFLGEVDEPADQDALGELVVAARGGGEPSRTLLSPLEFEHLLSFKELSFGQHYQVYVRWLSPWRVSGWASPVKVAVELSAPEPSDHTAVRVTPLAPTLLPRAACATDVEFYAEQDAFPLPVVADVFELAWAPFHVNLWGGGRMEYEIQKQCMLWDRGATRGACLEEDVDSTPWENIGVVLTKIEDATGLGVDEQAVEHVAVNVGRVLRFIASELRLSAEYRFRVRARLLFHPASGNKGEWSEYIESMWHRTQEEVVEPAAPCEAIFPDPMPSSLLEDGTTLLSFALFPRLLEDSDRVLPPPPSPYLLQYRPAEEPETAPWLNMEYSRLDPNRIVIADPRLKLHLDHGVCFRLWRCRAPPGSADGAAHAVDDDLRVRHFAGIASRPSRPICVGSPKFAEMPTLAIVLGDRPRAKNARPSTPCPNSDSEDCDRPTLTSRHHTARPLIARVKWSTVIPANPGLAPVRVCQFRYRLVREADERAAEAADAAKDVSAPVAEEVEHEPRHEEPWHLLEPFERENGASFAEVVHDLRIARPLFSLGEEYELSVRIGTSPRWGVWSPSMRLNLRLRPPEPPTLARVTAEMVSMPDGAVFFRMSWPAFKFDPLCTQVEYRIRMERRTRYKYSQRLSAEMQERSEGSLEAQNELHLVGIVRCAGARRPGEIIVGEGAARSAAEKGVVEFFHRLAAHPECGYRFIVDARHERCSEVAGATGVAQGVCWSKTIHSSELQTPPHYKNWFVPSQLPLEVSPVCEEARLRAPFPLDVSEFACERWGLSNTSLLVVGLFAPWKRGEAAKWPHRIEYAPYIPRSNPTRFPIPGYGNENNEEWFVPETVEYVTETSKDGLDQLVDIVLVKGFDMTAWDREQAKHNIHKQHAEMLGDFLRIRVVKEGGPEGLQHFSVPSMPLRLRMPPLQRPPSVTTWCAYGKCQAVVWWPCYTAMAGEDDKNIMMANQVHQIRMRRPFFEMGSDWVDGPIKTTQAPLMLRVNKNSEKTELHAADWIPLIDDSHKPDPNVMAMLPTQPTGRFPERTLLIYEFSVRVGDGYRWSDWSTPSESALFALDLKIVKEAPVNVEKLSILLEPTSKTVAPAEQLVETYKDLFELVEFDEDGDLVPPQWVIVERAQARAAVTTEAGMKIHHYTPQDDAQQASFVVSWPILPPQSFCAPQVDAAMETEEMYQAGIIPGFVPPAVLYRLNVWLVGSASDAAPLLIEQDSHLDASSDTRGLLVRSIDIPPSAFPEPTRDEYEVDPEMLQWALPNLLPDCVYTCSVEAKFETPATVQWWTPLMRSTEFTVPRVPAPAPPAPVPLCRLPTPDYKKVLDRNALGSSAIVAVRWPFPVGGNAAEAVRSAPYALEFCRAATRPGLTDPTARPGIAINGVDGPPRGPWHEVQAVQLCYANFEKGQVTEELPFYEAQEANWIPILVASGLRPDFEGWAAPPRSEDLPEASFVHVRWRYQASAFDLATSPPPLHSSAASEVLRTRVVNPLTAPQFLLDIHHRRIVASVKWASWAGAASHQFSYRILGIHKSKKRKKKRATKSQFNSGGGQQSDTISEAGSDCGSVSDVGSLAPSTFGVSHLLPVTGWIEMPPTAEGIERKTRETDDFVVGVAPPEDVLTADYQRRLPPAEWNSLLFRHYQDQPEFWTEGKANVSIEFGSMLASTAGSQSGSVTSLTGDHTPRLTRQESADSVGRGSRSAATKVTFESFIGSEKAFTKSQSSTHLSTGATDEVRRKTGSIKRSSSSGGGGSQYKGSNQPNSLGAFRMQYGMLVEWRVRQSDGWLWSQWSLPSKPLGLVPPLPAFESEVRADFSRLEPTTCRFAWRACKLPEEYEHLSKTVEYVAYVTTDTRTAQSVLQAGAGTFSELRMHRIGLQLSEGTCGVLDHYDGEENTTNNKFEFDDLFSGSSELRLVGKFTQSQARRISFEGESGKHTVMGFQLTVSGLKPESVNRFTVRARCATAGLDDLDWQNLRAEPTHPLRWSDPVYARPILTPKHPPPLLVPEAIAIPDGRFARFRHTPCLLLKSAVFVKRHPDDFDKEHPVVVDVKRAGAPDQDYVQVPLSNSVYCETDSCGPCRLIHNLPYMHVELRARNTVMNGISAACPPIFAVPPMPLEVRQGPRAELNITEQGNLFVTLTWTTRCLPSQNPSLVQVSLRRHSVESPPQDLEAISFTPAMVVEEVPPNAVVAAGEDYDRLAAEAEKHQHPPPPLGERSCPFLCRRCFLPLDKRKPADEALMGQYALARLQAVSTSLAEGALRCDEVPAHRGWEDDLRLLRAPHITELQAQEAEKNRLEGKHPPPAVQKRPPTCGCRDIITRKAFPVDGTTISYGTVYRFRVRVRDAILWSEWTEFSAPLHAMVPPPRVPMPLQDPQCPEITPEMLVQLTCDVEADKWAHSLGRASTDARLSLTWPRFQSAMEEVEYRVYMWTLSPEQQRRAAVGRGNLPPLLGTQLLTKDLPIPAGVGRTAPPTAIAKPCSNRLLAKPEQGSDDPQMILSLRPFEPPPRANVLRRTPKKASAAATTPGKEVSAAVAGEAQKVATTVTVEVHVLPLPKGHGYVFGVEAKHSAGACGNLGNWSAPLFSRFVEFESAPKYLSLEVEGRFGSILFKGTAATRTQPVDEQITFHAHPVTYVDEHRELPKAMTLLPAGDPWPINSTAATGKYLVRARGQLLASEDAGHDVLTPAVSPRRPLGDEKREH